MLLGLREFQAALNRVEAEAEAAARANVTAGAALIEKTAKANFEGSHRRGQPHVGGDKPNVITGTLRRSIRHDPVARYGFAVYGTRVGPTTIYARSVELGNKPGMRGYPYFTPAVHAAAPGFLTIVETTWRRFLRA